MNRKQMTQLSRHSMHQVAPREWRTCPNVTGDYDLDETILHRHNKDLPHRLELYVKNKDFGYGMRNGYHGNKGYGKDT